MGLLRFKGEGVSLVEVPRAVAELDPHRSADHVDEFDLGAASARIGGPVAVVHFDAHLDTWDTYFGAPVTHGTPFRRASEEGLLDLAACMHVGTRGPLYARDDLVQDAQLGFAVVSADEVGSEVTEVNITINDVYIASESAADTVARVQ